MMLFAGLGLAWMLYRRLTTHRDDVTTTCLASPLHDRATRGLESRPVPARALVAQSSVGRHRRRGRAAARDGLRHRLGREARTGTLYGDYRRSRRLDLRRQPRADRR